MEKIGYLGPEGSYSHIAARLMRPQAELKAYLSFPQVFSSLASETDAAVVPIENSLNGGVVQNIDLLQSSEKVYAAEELKVKIDHRLVIKEGASKKDITRIYSHSQALGQCADYLAKNFPEAKLVAVESTTAGLEMIKSKSDACIAGAHTIKQGVSVLNENIADEENNVTAFLLLKKGEIPDGKKSERIYFSVTCENRTGELLSVLSCISGYNLNMTKIESRPLKDRCDEYRFFIEVEGDYSDPAVRNSLDGIKSFVKSFKILGCY